MTRRRSGCVVTLRWTAVAWALGTSLPSLAAAQNRTVHGWVRDTTGAPIARATVRVESATGASGDAPVLTDADGAFRVRVRTEATRVLVTAHRLGFAPLSIVASLDSADREWRLVMHARAASLDPVLARAGGIQQIAVRRDAGSSSSAITSSMALTYPLDPGDLTELARHLDPGIIPATADDGSPLPPVIAGQPPGAASITLDGSTTSASTLPAEALSSVRTFTSTYDVSRGLFASGQIVARTRSGTDEWQAVASPWIRHPLVGASPRGPGSTTLWNPEQATLSGAAGGPLVAHRVYVYAAADMRLATSDPPTVASADGRAWSLLAVSPDSVRRVREIANARGLAPLVEPVDAARRTMTSTGMVRLDAPVGASHTATVRADWLEQRTTSSSAYSVSGPSGDRHTATRGAFAAFTSVTDRWTNEVRAYRQSRRLRGDPRFSAPQISVDVASRVADSLALATLTLGSNATVFAAASSVDAELADDFMWNLRGIGNVISAGFVARSERSSERRAGNPFGAFDFANVGDFEALRPSSFARTLGVDEPADARTNYGGVYLGTTRWVSSHLGFTAGVRGEVTRFPARSVSARALALVPSAQGAMRTDPSLSPRMGFRFSPSERVSITGGSGVFRAPFHAVTLAAPLADRGVSELRRLTCIGGAVPAPRWTDYLRDASTSPVACVGDDAVVASALPSATVFERDFQGPRLWRSSLGVLFGLGGLTSLGLEASAATSRTETLARDRNLNTRPRFVLADEDARPVFADQAAIDPETGLISPLASRLDPMMGVVRELSSTGRARTLQLTARFGGIIPGLRQSTFGALGYAYTDGRSQNTAVSGIATVSAATAGDPNAVTWGATRHAPRHAIEITTSSTLRPGLTLSFIGSLRSGIPYTPRVTGDVNGDGSSNDRAFVFDPNTVHDATLADGMRALMERSPAGSCLRRQRGQIAGLASCASTWTHDVSAGLRFAPRRAQHLSVSLNASNLLAALDQALHGRSGVKGWGDAPLIDDRLLRVRGFDPTQRAFQYEVNPNFGGPLRDVVSSPPFALQLRVRVAIGGDPAKAAAAAGASGDAGRGELAATLRRAIVNTPAQVLRLAEAGSLELDVSQRIRLQLLADSIEARIDASVAALTNVLSAPTPSSDEEASRARRTALVREAQQLIEWGVSGARTIVGPLVWEQVPEGVRAPSRSIPLGVRREQRTSG